MGRDKALLKFRGRAFLTHLVYLLLPRVGSVTVVLGHHADRVAAALPESPRVRAAVNADYDRGMLSSLQRGLSETSRADWILWMLVDHPAVRGRLLDELLAVAADSDAPVVIPRHRGERGHPIILSRAVADEILRLPPDRSPQDVVRRHYPEARFVDSDDSGVLIDVDRPEDYERLVAGQRA